MEDKNLNGAALAFLGDAVFELLIRERIAAKNMPLKDLHKQSVAFANASSQSVAYNKIKDLLTEEELAVFKRGRNTKVSNIPKNSTVAEYHTATGLEALFGYLFINKQYDRLNKLMDIIFDK